MHEESKSLLVGIADDMLGGISKYAEGVAVAGADAGFEVTLIASDSSMREKLERQFGAMGIDVIDLGVSRPGEMKKVMRRLIPGGAARLFSSASSKRMRRLGKRFGIAHLNMGLAQEIRPFAGKVVVAAWFYPHDLKTRILSQWRHTGGNPRSGYVRRAVITAKGIALYRMDERGFRGSDLVLAPTQLLADHLRGLGIPCEKCAPPVWLTPPGSNGEKGASPAESRKNAGGNSELTLVTCCADLSNPRKNVGDLLRTVGRIAETGTRVRLKAVGGGTEKLHKQLSMLPPNATVEFTGSLPRDLVHHIVRRADLFVTSSLYEEWGYAVVEALLCGTPVVAYPVYPFAEILRDGFGTVAREMSPVGLAQAIISCTGCKFRPDLAQAASDRFGATAIGARLREIWNRNGKRAIT